MNPHDKRTDATISQVLEIAQTVCTRPELDAIRMAAAGMSQRRIAHLLDISRSSVRDRLASAISRILDTMTETK